MALSKSKIEKAIKIMESIISEGFSMGLAKNKAIKALKINKNQESDLAAADIYKDLKSKYRTRLYQDKRWVKK